MSLAFFKLSRSAMHSCRTVVRSLILRAISKSLQSPFAVDRKC